MYRIKKHMKHTFLIGIALLLSFATTKVKAQDAKETIRILFIFDGSNSMRARWESTSKIEVARKLMLRTLDSLQSLDNVELALRLYGHQTKIQPGQQDCSDTRLEVPFGSSKTVVPSIKDKLRSLDCQGTTPIALSLEQAGNMDFPDCDNCRNVIILVTDGVEACDGDPCAVSRALNRKGIKLKPFIIGVGLDTSYLGQFSCVGEFLSADTEDSFENVLSYVISQAVNNTTVQVNLNDIRGKALETNVAMSFYNQKSGKLVETYMHTMNVKHKPDTISLNPLYTYRLEVHTIPVVRIENIKLKPGTHNVITADAPQGFLQISVQSKPNQTSDIQCVVRQNGKMETLNIQELNTKEKYIVGTYDLEILTLPRKYIDKVNIKQGMTSKIAIPENGYLNLNKRSGPCQMFHLQDGKEIWISNVSEDYGTYSIALQPGKYKLVYRSNGSFSAANTIEKEIVITQGYEELVKL
jgi:Ca-activated chloride channel family protein